MMFHHKIDNYCSEDTMRKVHRLTLNKTVRSKPVLVAFRVLFTPRVSLFHCAFKHKIVFFIFMK